MSSYLIGRFGAPAAFNPVTDIAWAHLYYTGGPNFVALGLSNGATMGSTNWPDEIAAHAADLTGGGGTYQSANAAFNSKPSVLMPASGAGKKHTTSVAAGAQVSLPYTIVCVFQLNTVNTAKYIFDVEKLDGGILQASYTIGVKSIG